MPFLQTDRRDLSQRQITHYLGIIFLLAAGLRLLALDFQSLWLDELYTMNMADPANSWRDIYNLSFTHDPLSVLYFVLLNSFFKVLGYSAFTAKLLSSVFGIAAVGMCYLLGKRLHSVRVGLYAAFLMAVNPFNIYYSQEARVYTMYLFSAALSFYCLLGFIKEPKSSSALTYGLSVLFMLLSHFFGFFVLLSQVSIYLFFAIRDKRLKLMQHVRLTALAAGVCILGYLPFIPIFIMLTKSKGTWIDPPKMDALLRLYHDFQGGSWILLAIGLLLMLFILLFRVFFKGHPSEVAPVKDAVVFLSLWIVISFLVPFLLSVFNFPIFYKRYMISYLSPFLLLSAIGLAELPVRWLRNTIIGVICLATWYHLFPVTHYYSRIAKSDFRGTSEYILQHNQPGLTVYTSLPYHFGYYFRQAQCESMIQSNNLDSLCNAMRRGASPLESFWFADAHGRAFSVSPSNQEFLNKEFDLFLMQESFDSWARLYLRKDQNEDGDLVIKREDMRNGEEITGSLFVNGQLTTAPVELEEGTYQLIAKVLGTPYGGVAGRNAHVTWLAGEKGVGSYFTGPGSFIAGDTLRYEQKNKGSLTFNLRFDNDSCLGKADRNIVFRSLTIRRLADTLLPKVRE